MSTDQEFLNLAGAEPENQTLFDELAGLVPAERQAEYYRVIAHTRTLSPNDEMLRLLEAMGILALLTGETPVAIAVERKSLQKILENALSKAGEVEKRMAAYTPRLESRIAQLPKELERGLDPPRIAKLLGESLRQCFQQSGLPDTARALHQSCSEMNSVQKQLVNILREVAHPDIGVIAKVRSANDSLLQSMTTRAQQIDDVLGRLERQGLDNVAACRCQCRPRIGLLLGYLVCQRAASNTGDTKRGSVTTGLAVSRRTGPSASAAECKAPLRGDHITTPNSQ